MPDAEDASAEFLTVLGGGQLGSAKGGSGRGGSSSSEVVGASNVERSQFAAKGAIPMRPTRKNILGLSTLPQTASILTAAADRYTTLLKKKNRGRRNSSDSSVRSPTSTSTEVRSPTRTKTATSTDAYTAGNITVTGGAGAGATTVIIRQRKASEDPRGGQHAPRNTDKSNPADDLRIERIVDRYTSGRGSGARGWAYEISGSGVGWRKGPYKTRKAAARALRAIRKEQKRANCGGIQRYRLNLGRTNSSDSAAARYEVTHGRPPANDFVIKTPIHSHSVVSGIGDLKELLILAVSGDRQIKVEGFKGAILAESTKGTQLYIKGGDQAVNLKDFGISQPHEAEILGALLNVVYFTTKDHLMPEDGGTANYKHKFGKGRTKRYVFGKKGARLPMVGYDVRNKLLSIQGGTYKIVAEGIDG